MINATFASYLHPLFCGLQTWHLPSLPYIFTSQYLHIGDGHICKEHNYKFVKSSTFGLGLKVYKYVTVHPMQGNPRQSWIPDSRY